MNSGDIRLGGQDVLHDSPSADSTQEVPNYDPLVVPLHTLLRAGEPVRGVEKITDDCVVETHHNRMKLSDNDVFIIAVIANNGSLIRRAGQVMGSCVGAARQWGSQDEPVTCVSERFVFWPRAVDRVEIQSRRPKVVQRVRVVQLRERGPRVERDVVVDELAQVRVAGGNGHVLLVVAGIGALRVDDLALSLIGVLEIRGHGRRQLTQKPFTVGLRELQGREGAKHSPESAVARRRRGCAVKAPLGLGVGATRWRHRELSLLCGSKLNTS